jgi:hypothetical protein
MLVGYRGLIFYPARRGSDGSVRLLFPILVIAVTTQLDCITIAEQ